MQRRQTNHISRRQASNSRPAILLAEKLGTPLNQLVTINFTKQGMEDEDAILQALDKIRARYCRWAKAPGKRRGGKPYKGAMIWALERTAHWAAHLLLHVPPSRLARFKVDIEGWIEKESGQPIELGAIDVKLVYNVFGLRKYLLKALNPAFCALYRIRHVPQGTINGKRFGYTQNLGPSECIKHGTKKPYRWPRRAPPPGNDTGAQGIGPASSLTGRNHERANGPERRADRERSRSRGEAARRENGRLPGGGPHADRDDRQLLRSDETAWQRPGS
jgi:hypothetical protein